MQVSLTWEVQFQEFFLEENKKIKSTKLSQDLLSGVCTDRWGCRHAWLVGPVSWNCAPMCSEPFCCQAWVGGQQDWSLTHPWQSGQRKVQCRFHSIASGVWVYGELAQPWKLQDSGSNQPPPAQPRRRGHLVDAAPWGRRRDRPLLSNHQQFPRGWEKVGLG